jgi:tetratricopeptide (TPR) repeat protein
MLELRGVTEVNRNDWDAARQDFLDAYKLDPQSAFTLNNLGYVAERDGDPETAQFFYARARHAGDAGARIGLATQSSAEGQHLAVVASDSTQKVDGELQGFRAERQRETGPVELTPRYGTLPPAGNPPAGAAPQSSTPPQP